MRAVTGVGRSLGAAVTGSRPLSDFEIVPLLGAGLLLIGTAVATWFYPWLVAGPIVVLAGWAGLSLVTDAIAHARRERRPKR